MAVIFPESMNRLDLSDPSGSLSTVENYIRYMTERMEFSNKKWNNEWNLFSYYYYVWCIWVMLLNFFCRTTSVVS